MTGPEKNDTPIAQPVNPVGPNSYNPEKSPDIIPDPPTLDLLDFLAADGNPGEPTTSPHNRKVLAAMAQNRADERAFQERLSAQRVREARQRKLDRGVIYELEDPTPVPTDGDLSIGYASGPVGIAFNRIGSAIADTARWISYRKIRREDPQLYKVLPKILHMGNYVSVEPIDPGTTQGYVTLPVETPPGV